MDGRNVHVRFDREIKEHSQDHTVSVFVGNLPFEITESELESFFVNCPPRHLRIVTNMTGRSRGFALLQYATIEEAELATANMHLFNVKGRKLQVS